MTNTGNHTRARVLRRCAALAAGLAMLLVPLAAGTASAAPVTTNAHVAAAQPQDLTPPPPDLPPPWEKPHCGQPSHVWIATSGGSLGGGNTVNVPKGTAVYLTGVVASQVVYHFNYSGGIVDWRETTVPDNNCVIHHEDNEYWTANVAEQITVTADYWPWEANTPEVIGAYVGTINLY